MTDAFKKIGLFAKYNDTSVADVFETLLKLLEKRHHEIVIEKESSTLLKKINHPVKLREDFAKGCDLIIVVGGDGSLLNAGRAIVPFHVPILGINRGKLGFLADILPLELEKQLLPILEGEYSLEYRTLLQTKILRSDQIINQSCALNDTVLYTAGMARMVGFEVWINDQFVLNQRSDGLIVATPTGSTAYALSGGGPILTPTLNAFTLVPMMPHTLTSRPIVVDYNAKIELVITEKYESPPRLSCDGQIHLDLQYGDKVLIEKYPHDLGLIHPKDHNYFEVLRQKLGWSTTVTSDRVKAC